MSFSRAAGGVILGDSGAVALVRTRDGNGAWLFPKGHIEQGETDEDAAQREIREETGLATLEYIDDLGTYTRQHINADGSASEEEQKEIHMFLFAAESHAKLIPTMEIDAAEWVPLRELNTRIGNIKDRLWFASVFDRVQEAVQRD